MKKFTFLFTLILVCLISVLAFASCSDEEENVQSCNHTFGEWVVSKQATCTEAGYKERYCYLCDITIGMTTKPTGHNWVEATCQSPKTCSSCFTTEGELGAHKEVVIPAVKQTCLEEGATAGVGCSVCDAVLVAPEVIPPHFRKEIPAVASTCSKEGSTAGERCYVCAKVLIAPQPVSCHEPVPFGGLAATCVTNGLTIGTSCSICNEPVSGHFTTEFIDHTYDESNCCTQCGNKKPSEGLKYTAMDNGSYYAVTGLGTCTDTDIVISPTYNGKLVKYIATNAFKYCSTITSVTIPNTVYTIGDKAFYGCTSLKSVVMPDTIVNIRDSAFAYSDKLESINISTAIKNFSSNAFEGCVSVLKLENGVYYVDTWAYDYKTPSDDELVDENGEKIPYVITIKDGTIGIASSAFSNCTAERIILPDSVTYIDVYAFFGCHNLTDVTLPSRLTAISDYLFYGCDKLSKITIPQGVNAIGEYAFYGCSEIKEITIPAKVMKIGAFAFSETSISKVTFENVFNWFACMDGEEMKPMYVNLGEELAQKLKVTYADHVWSRIITND